MILKRSKTKEEKYKEEMTEVFALLDWVEMEEWKASTVAIWATKTRKIAYDKFNKIQKKYGKEE